MNAQDDEKIRKLLQKAFPPVDDSGPPRDLWPVLLQRLDDQAPRVPWFDWVFAGVIAALLLVFPDVIPVLFYHL